MYIVYGIKNCNTVKKAIDWLNEHKIPFEFHNYKTQGISQQKLNSWCRQVGSEVLVNKKGTTWRQLDEATKAKKLTQKESVRLMATHTSMIKRPVIEQDDKVIVVGFDQEQYPQLFL